MLVTCPKCNFVQPGDRYCAKCGVDMENFAPAKGSIVKRTLGHPAVYAILAIIAIVAVMYVVRINFQPSDKTRQYQNGLVVADQRNNGLPGPARPVGAPGQLAEQDPNLATSSTGATSSEDPAKKQAEASEGVKVHILYAEVDHQTMEMLKNESQSTQQHSDLGDFRVGALPAKIHPDKERGVHVLERVEKTFDSHTLTQQWFAGKKNAENEPALGLTTSLTLENVNSSSLKGEIEITKRLMESADPAEVPAMAAYPPVSFDLSPGMSWMITMRLAAVPQDEPGTTSEGFLKIFQSPQYKSKQTEFTLFFEFDTPAGNAGKN